MRPNIYPRHYIKVPAIGKELFRHQSMDVQLPFGIVAEGMDGQGNIRNSQLFIEGNLKKTRQTRCCALAQLAEQFAIIEKISAKNFRDAEHILALRDGKKNTVKPVSVWNHEYLLFWLRYRVIDPMSTILPLSHVYIISICHYHSPPKTQRCWKNHI